MAQINASTGEQVFKINKWLGVNENPDGDTHLKMGEAASMSNFRITDDFSLQKRNGSLNVAGLLSAYAITTAEETTTVATDLNTPTSTFTAYPTISVSAGGILSLSGTPVTVTQANITSYTSYYWSQNGLFYKVGACTYAQPSTGTLVTGGSITLGDSYKTYVGFSYAFHSVGVASGAVYGVGDHVSLATGTYAYSSTYGLYYYIFSTGTDSDGDDYHWVQRVSVAGNDTYTFAFYPVTATTASSDVAVRGIWSGYVGSTEYLVSACNDHLWSLTVADGVWTKTDLGAITTTAPVHFFGFDSKLYMMNGTQYKVWNGTAIADVAGYAPVIATATPPAGGGTLLEQVNKLTGQKRQQFSPDGTATVFQLAETAVTSIDSVKLNGTEVTTDITKSTTNGTVTWTTAPTAGTNTIEITWTKGTSDRAAVLAMKYSEMYNGSNDNRIFIYGDGSNQTFYSGLDDTGKPNAEYFPDLNEMEVGDSNTQITGLVRHYNRLIAYKDDSVYSIAFDIITLDDGSVTAAFYVTPVNKGIGNCALGQVQLVENYPRSLDGRSVYEWKNSSSNITNDQRNAKRISQRIEETLGTFDLPSAVTYFDKINHEYYIMQNNQMIVQNTENDTWYIYANLPATCMTVYKDEVYFGTTDGCIRHFSADYTHDNGANIACTWESGSMDFGMDFKRKYSANVWVGIKPESSGSLTISAETDDQTESTVLTFTAVTAPQMERVKVKVKKFTYYKLKFATTSASTSVTVTSADMRVRFTGNVR